MLLTQDALKKANVSKPQTLRFLTTNQPDTSCNNLNPDVSTYWEKDFTPHTNFSRQQTHQDFKLNISHDAFQNESDEGPYNCVDSEDELESVDEDEDEDWVDVDKDEQENELDCNENHDQTGINIELDDDDAFLHEEPGEENAQEKEAGGKEAREEEARGEETQEEEAQEEESQEGESQLDSEPEIPRPSASLSVETDADSGIHTRGQIAAYAGIGLSMSFRRHFFSMLILGRYARFIR